MQFTSNQSRVEAGKNGRKGGIASGISRRERKAIREALNDYLQEIDPETGEQRVITLCRGILAKAMNGDVKACEFIRDSIGEKPIEKKTYTADCNFEALEKAFFVNKS